MIIFDIEDFMVAVRRDGIEPSDPKAKAKLEVLSDYFKFTRKYNETKARESIRKIAGSYFQYMAEGEPERILKSIWRRDSISPIYKSACMENPEIVVYESEWNKIKELESVDLQKLAFATLCVVKFVGRKETEDGSIRYYPYTFVKKPDIWNISGVKTKLKKTETWHELKKNGFFDSDAVIKRNESAKIRIGVPYNVDAKEDKSGEKVKFIIEQPSQLMKYFDYHSGKRMELCECCGVPILWISGQKICTKCKTNKRKSQQQKYRQKSKSDKKLV